MRILPGVLTGSLVFEPQPLEDDARDRAARPTLTQTFDVEQAASAGLDCRNLVQDIRIQLERAEVHGLTLRTDGGEGMLVSCCAGTTLSVAVDLRPGSPTYRSWMTVVLDDVEHRSVWLPPGLAHGFQALAATATVCCRVNRVRQPLRETTIAPDDPELAIPWPLPVKPAGVPTAPAELASVEPFLSDWFGALT